MSNPDSFIDEVTEEVRRDRLFRLFRKYGWIGVVIILGLVGGTAWTEWSKTREAARAQAFGDAMLGFVVPLTVVTLVVMLIRRPAAAGVP